MGERSLNPKFILNFNEDGKYDGKFWFDDQDSVIQLSLFNEESISERIPIKVEGEIHHFEPYGNIAYLGLASFDFGVEGQETVDFITDKLDQETHLITKEDFHWSNAGYKGIFEIINQEPLEVKFISIKK
jgi:hypothetical protein